MDTRIAVVGSILENPQESQEAFNATVAEFRHLVKARMGVPFEQKDLSVISIIVEGALDEINAFTGKLGRISGVTSKTAISGKQPGGAV
ncbi:MAG: iron-only hydrogenase system regulator [Spirochaetaceae bacterium]|jgi:putative iron-only hydrogenase system regulator|nr:iron-only hydrogenase system regulator [Spirochaetaceae bacterium]